MEVLKIATELTRLTEPISSTISARISAHMRTARTQTSCTTTAMTGNTTRTRAIGRYGVVRSTRVKYSHSWRRTDIIFIMNTLTMVMMRR